MDLIKTIGAALYARVFVAYKTTLLGLAIVAISEITNTLNLNPSPAVRIVAAVLGVALMLLKSKQTDPAAPQAPAAK